jgi:hypothetical protein
MSVIPEPKIGDVRPIDPSKVRDINDFCQPAHEWEIYTSTGWRNLAAETARIAIIERYT